MKGEYITLRIPRSMSLDIPRDTMKLAEDRTSYLFAHVQFKTIRELLANAWLQGVHDAAQVTILKTEGE